MRRKVVMLAIALAPLGMMSSGCVPRARMCTASSECENKSACVAGRCQVEKASVKPAVDSARRLVVRPLDVAYVKRSDGASNGALPTVFSLGKDDGKLFLRFSVAIPEAANIVEAYVVLHRSSLVDDDPASISLHATRIIDSWQGGSVSWAMQPRSTETRSPTTLVEQGGPTLVRLDVRELVRHWGRHDPSDQGIAVTAENETRTGMTFALSGGGAERTPEFVASAAVLGSSSSQDVEPYLELYVR